MTFWFGKDIHTLLAFCHLGFPSQRAINTELWCLFNDKLHKLLNKQLSCRLFDMPWSSCDVTIMYLLRNRSMNVDIKYQMYAQVVLRSSLYKEHLLYPFPSPNIVDFFLSDFCQCVHLLFSNYLFLLKMYVSPAEPICYISHPSTPFYYHGLPLIPAWISNHIKCGTKLLIHS